MKTQKGATLVGSLLAITILATTFVSVLELQTSIIRSKFFLQYDNTANLLVSEGVEIIRSIHEQDVALSNGKYRVDHTTVNLNNANTNCIDNSPNTGCALAINSTTGAYTLSSTGNQIFHRFVTITNSNDTPKVTSTVVVRNPKGGSLRVYKATIELYKIN